MIPVLYTLAALALSAYVALDGFDLGAGALHLWIAKNDSERRTVMAAIGPFWDGNEVWLIASAGLLFAVFPAALAIAFSGFYLALFLVVWSLLLRAVSIELRSHVASPLWSAFWDFVFCASSGTLTILFGVALGNLLRGVPTEGARWFTLPLFTTFRPRPPVGLLDFYTVTVGAFSSIALAHHGALFLTWKTAGPVRDRAERFAARLFPAVLVLLVGVFLATEAVLRFVPAVRAVPIVALAVAALIASAAFRRRGRERAAFLASCAFLVLALGSVAATLFPTLLRSIDGLHDLTAYDAAAKPYGQWSALFWLPMALILVAIYFANLFRIYRGKVNSAEGDA